MVEGLARETCTFLRDVGLDSQRRYLSHLWDCIEARLSFINIDAKKALEF